MSCNIKLAVNESSQLSVSLVVLACRAAHLCLLDKTCSTLPRENTLSLFLFFFSFSLQCFLFYFVSSLSVIHFVYLSHFLLSSQHFITFYLVYFYLQKRKVFFKSISAFPPNSSPRCPLQFIFCGSPSFSFSTSLLFPLSLFSCCPFLFCIILGPLCQSFGLQLRHLFVSGVHLFSAPG